MNEARLPVSIDFQPWYADHNVGGKIILAAVETMMFLAAAAVESNPGCDIRLMRKGRFAKFLEFPPGAATIKAQTAAATGAPDWLQTRLITRMQLKKMSRIKEHGSLFFPLSTRILTPPADIDPAPPASPLTMIEAEKIYRKLVPFGPQYQTLQGPLHLTADEAWGELRAPCLPAVLDVQDLVGSPFPFDGALHAACVLGRQYVDFSPFPVGFETRTIFRPTVPGGRYRVKAMLTSRTPEEMLFDLAIHDNRGQVFEIATGIRMRDVSRAIPQ